MKHYLIGVLIGLDVHATAILGGDYYATISCRIGQSIQEGGWASRVRWPERLRQHFLQAIYERTV